MWSRSHANNNLPALCSDRLASGQRRAAFRRPVRLKSPLGSCLLALTFAWMATFYVSLIARGADWPQFGRDATRNAVSAEQGPPTMWDIGKFDEKTGEPIAGTAKNIKWQARLGNQTVGDPVVVDGRVWVGTNNVFGKDVPDASVLACFRESDGKPLYRYVSPRLAGGRNNDWPYASMACSPLIEGDRLWFVTNRAEVVCLDIGPLKKNEGEPRIVWKIDMMDKYGVHPVGSRMWLMRICSIAGYRDLIYVVTGNGAAFGTNDMPIPNPAAPSLLCLRKDTGEEVWRDKSPGENIQFGQWSSPTVVEVGTRAQCIVGQGDGWVRSFDALTGAPIWQFDMNHKESKWAAGGRSTRNSIVASPVFADGRIYIASGQYVEFGEGQGRLVCLDPARQGDISTELAVDAAGKTLPQRRVQAVDSARGEKAIPNPNSGLVWEFVKTPGAGDDFEDHMHRTIVNVAVHKGLVIAGDFSGLVHCFDAKTGQRFWAHDLYDVVCGTPLIVDGKVYIPGQEGNVSIFGLSSDPNRAMRRLNGVDEPLRKIETGDMHYCSPIFAQGVLYLATRSRLFAVAAGQDELQANVTGGYWPQWRGPNRDNVSSETGLLREWPAGGPPRLWTAVGLGEGIASVSVAEGLIFTVGYQDDSEYAVALHEATGELAWATRIGPAVAENPLMRWLSQRVPAVDHDRVYAFTAGGDLICLRTADGSELWRKNYRQDFVACRPIFGFYEQPLIDGDRLVCTPRGSKAQLVFLDKRTGDVQLLAGGQSEVGRRQDYVAAVSAEVAGVRQYVTFLDQQLTSVAADDGRVLWRYDHLYRHAANSQTPIVRGDEVFCSAGYGGVAALLKVDQKDNVFRLAEQYQRPANVDFVQDATLLWGDHLYAADRNTALKCLSWRTGDLCWWEQFRGLGRIGLTCADGRLYVRGSEGKMLLVEAAPEKFVARGGFAIPDHKQAIGSTAPVVAGGRLYLRDGTRLHVYDVRANRPAEAAPAQSVALPKLGANTSDNSSARAPRKPLVPKGVYVPTPHDVVKRMLELAEVVKTDVVCDLGSGDGRIVIAAAKQYGCRALGYDIDRELVAAARAEAAKQGVEKFAAFERGDVFEVDLAAVNVVTLYLLPQQNEKLVAQFNKMRPGSRIVSHQFAIPGIAAKSTVSVPSEESGEKHTLYLYRLPLKAQTPSAGN